VAFKTATIYTGISLPSLKITTFITDVNYTLKTATLYNALYGVSYNGSHLTATLNFVAARMLAVRGTATNIKCGGYKHQVIRK